MDWKDRRHALRNSNEYLEEEKGDIESSEDDDSEEEEYLLELV